MARRTFFSFHYKPDVSRAQIVRNSWVTKPNRESAGFFDSSVFESKQRTSKDALKSFLSDGLKNTSVTCVLIGNETYARPWVRYEIIRSFQQGKGMLGVRVHGIKNLHGQLGTWGLNPFDYIRCNVIGQTVYWEILEGGTWKDYFDVPNGKIDELPYSFGNTQFHTFSSLFSTYDWVVNDGYSNIGSWIETAATKVGR